MDLIEPNPIELENQATFAQLSLSFILCHS